MGDEDGVARVDVGRTDMAICRQRTKTISYSATRNLHWISYKRQRSAVLRIDILVTEDLGSVGLVGQQEAYLVR